MAQDEQQAKIDPAIHTACKAIAASEDTGKLYHLVERMVINKLILPRDPDLAKQLIEDLKCIRFVAKHTRRRPIDKDNAPDPVPPRLDSRKLMSEVLKKKKAIRLHISVMEQVVEIAKETDAHAYTLLEDTLIEHVMAPVDRELAIRIRDTIQLARLRSAARRNGEKIDLQSMSDNPSPPIENDYPCGVKRLIVVGDENK